MLILAEVLFSLNVDLKHKAACSNRFADYNDVTKVNSCPFAFFIKRSLFIKSRDFLTNDRPGSKWYIFDLRYQQKFATPQSLKVKFEYSQLVDAVVRKYVNAFRFTNKSKPNTSVGQRHSDIFNVQFSTE